MPFQNRVAIVTGGASGIGRALCEELARRGAIVVSADITPEAGRDRATQVDVRDAQAVQAVVDAVAKEHGRLDFIFNNAGIGAGGEMRELTLEDWRTVVEINLMGVVHGVLAAYPLMLRQGSGHIVNIASLSGLIPSPGLGPYTTTKGAVVSLTNALRAEAEALGVRASVVCPGFIDTAIFDQAIGIRMDKEDLLKKLRLPLMKADVAARAILDGVERNQAIIVFPWSARLLWRITRYCPWLILPFVRRMTAQLRQVKRA